MGWVEAMPLSIALLPKSLGQLLMVLGWWEGPTHHMATTHMASIETPHLQLTIALLNLIVSVLLQLGAISNGGIPTVVLLDSWGVWPASRRRA